MLKSSRLVLRGIELRDINETYLSWLNDPEVNRFLETRFKPQTHESLRSYWESIHKDADSTWFAICLKSDSRHIGNIKLGPIEWIHRRADLSLFVGDRDSWGKGYGSEAISTLRDWAFLELDLQKLNAGIYSGNWGSRKAFEKCGFELEGVCRQEVLSRGARLDVWRLGLPRESWLTE